MAKPALGSLNQIDVLHVSEAYGGGVQSAINTYVQHSPEFSHQLFIRGRKDHDSGDSLDIETIHAEGSIQKFLRSAVRHIRTVKPRVVHLHSSYAGLLRAHPGVSETVIYSPHCFSFYRSDFPLGMRAVYYGIEKLLAKTSHTIAAVSPHEAAVASRMARGSNIQYLPNISNSKIPDSVSADRAKDPTVRRIPTIVCVGRISKQKDPEFLARCLDRVRVPVKCVWVGDGDPHLRGLLEKSGVSVTGWINSETVHKYIAESDLFLHTAEWEGAPITLVDAALIGVPVITRSISHLEGLGFVAGGASPRRLAETVDRFFSDVQYNKAIADQTQETALVHSAAAQRRALTALYRSSDREAPR